MMEDIVMEQLQNKRKVPQEIHDQVSQRIEEAGGLLEFIKKARREGKLVEFKPLPELNNQ